MKSTMSPNQRSADRPFQRPHDATAPIPMVSNAALARTTVGAHGEDQIVKAETSATTRYANRVGVKP